ncbi:MAG: S8 family serine peptidase [Steroidobacteraceae bacterium]|nr:S8 family serine peptidase [Steroidobacteraceae bacterium]MCW5572851.1 S8 family serine peptidase [Steroidobacteraceae bacterium]
MKRHFSVLVGAAALAALAAHSTAAPVANLPNASALALPAPVQTSRKIDPSLNHVKGEIDVVVQLAGQPLAIANGQNSKSLGGLLSKAQQRAHSASLSRDQDAMLARLLALGGREVARTRIAYNSVIVRIDAAQLYAVASYRDVVSVRPSREYNLDLSATVPQIGAAIAQAQGVTGAGVTVAVIDSGIDYTHYNLGGAGTDAAYEAAYGTSITDTRNTTRDGLFPTAKVVEGRDFIGELWPNAAAVPDDDPIDIQGHGTHVADIIAGHSADGAHKGVAPDAKLIAAKVCSSVATSCNGTALLQAMDYVLDPNGDGSMDDAVDVINMSLGSSYGQVEDDLSGASANAVAAGVVVVASAGNSADRPFITGSPASAPTVLSVAQTEVAGAVGYPLVINAPASLAGTYTNTATVEWAPVEGRSTSGNVVGVSTLACDGQALPALSGSIALIRRGTCSISQKVRNATAAGATGVILGLVASGDAVSFSNGGECAPDGSNCAPTLVVTQPVSEAIFAALAGGTAVSATISDAAAFSRDSWIVNSSSRGPSYSYAAIKPEIGAPGASVSAIAGSGTGEEAFGGTSGAAPMVSGAAALLLSKDKTLTPTLVRALLANTAETQIYSPTQTSGPELAPITRIGGGEVRVNRALASRTAAWDDETKTPALSFGYHSVTYPTVLKRTVKVRNFTSKTRKYSVKSAFRYANDNTGAVTVSAPSSVSVPANGTASFTVLLTINPAKLNDWPWGGGSAGSAGGDGPLLQRVEYDGYLTLKEGADDIHVPWHVLPKKAALVQAVGAKVTIPKGKTSAVLPMINLAMAKAGRVEPFALLGTSARIPRAQLPGPGDNFAVVDLQALGARLVNVGGGQFGLQVAVSTYGTRAYPGYPAEFDVYLDTNLDGIDDWVMYTAEASGFGLTGQTLVNVVSLSTGAGAAFYYADTDLESGNMIMTIPLAPLGINPAAPLVISAYAFDNYFTGNLTDYIEGKVYTPALPRFDVSLPPPAGINPLSLTTLTVTAPAGGAAASPSQEGLLFFYRDGNAGLEADAIAVEQR